MSNDKTTLADVQPGGGVRLGDFLPPLPCTHYNACGDGSEPLYTAEQMRDYARAALSALSAQPSPDGQGEAPEIEQIRTLVSSILSTVSLGHQKGPYAYAGEDFGRYLPEATRDCRAILRALSDLAARQPVGEPITVEAVAAVRRNSEGDRCIDWLTEGGIADLEVGDVLMVSDRAITDEDGSGEVYAAPPAHAVDLGAVRALLQRRIEQWRSHLPADPDAPGTREIETEGEPDYNNDVAIYRQGIAVMEEVLFKIDSKAVGNG
ncbi:hypothetical protein [Stenotrophomonas maltophilia]|uniref:hypothetical protein n=1 Tax=Stenotrophomonas maltophilia TaxID=40324 RepID=UPI0039C2CA3E